MSIDLQLNSSGDLSIVDFNMSLLGGSDQLIQKIAIKLKFFKGEWFLDTNRGIPYYENILIKNYDVGDIENIFKAALLELDDINRIISFDMNYDIPTKLLSVNFTLETVEGTIESGVTI